jgi:peptide/nickel transport system permease protein
MLVFFALRILPGDPVYVILSAEQVQQITPEQVEAIKKEYGLDKPLIVQYANWIKDTLRGDLGTSMRFNQDVSLIIRQRMGPTLHLGVVAFIVSCILGILAGVISAIRRGSWLDTVVTVLANIGITVPVFWLGIMMIYLFALVLNWLPVMSYVPPTKGLWESTRHLIMPVICLAVTPTAAIARQTRSSMLEVLHQDYIRTAWSKGLRERMVVFRHALKNSLIPVITLAGLSIATIFGGQVLIESVFNINGMGTLIVTSLLRRDYIVVQATTMLITLIIIIANLLIDLSYGWVDPRIRYR